MAKVFTGRVVIPGDKMAEYFEALQQAEAQRAPFRESLEQLNQEFAEFLAAQYGDKFYVETKWLLQSEPPLKWQQPLD
jgi:hypothetical protein